MARPTKPPAPKRATATATATDCTLWETPTRPDPDRTGPDRTELTLGGKPRYPSLPLSQSTTAEIAICFAIHVYAFFFFPCCKVNLGREAGGEKGKNEGRKEGRSAWGRLMKKCLIWQRTKKVLPLATSSCKLAEKETLVFCGKTSSALE